MNATQKLLHSILDEEVERIGAWDDGERKHYVFNGPHVDDYECRTLDAALEAAAVRSGMTVERIRQVAGSRIRGSLWRPQTPIMFSLRSGQVGPSEGEDA